MVVCVDIWNRQALSVHPRSDRNNLIEECHMWLSDHQDHRSASGDMYTVICPREGISCVEGDLSVFRTKNIFALSSHPVNNLR